MTGVLDLPPGIGHRCAECGHPIRSTVGLIIHHGVTWCSRACHAAYTRTVGR